eukprot:TRINITY_DN5363_c0_g1_i1.p1 TRINITY_DN5363_c0_g1~~TRINITY_DN5363_c0_g1_i1.p1  ORF type:complete len:588 (-),score=76.20 TRINITY_DN5363_c0_g1_i1:304-2067(-)
MAGHPYPFQVLPGPSKVMHAPAHEGTAVVGTEPQESASDPPSSTQGGGADIAKRGATTEIDPRTFCFRCKQFFTLLRWRHKCKHCRKYVCADCSPHRLPLPQMGLNKIVRVCNRCKPVLDAEERDKWREWDKLGNFEMLSFIGEGAYGKVYKVRHRATSKLYALKVVEKAKLKSTREVEHIWDEKHLLQIVSHPFIVKLHSTFQTPDKLFMVFDYLPLGDCYNLMALTRFPEEAVRIYAAQVALALGYLNDHNIMYRDLKPENCLLDLEGNMVLADLGLARVFGVGTRRMSRCGTPSYWAPERFANQPYSVAVDWWSLGCLIFELITAVHPFADQTGQVSAWAVEQEEPHFNVGVEVSDACIDLCALLLQKDPEKRLQSVEAMKEHPWFQGLDWEKVLRKEYPLAWKPPHHEEEDYPNTASDAIAIRPTSEGLRFRCFTWASVDGPELPGGMAFSPGSPGSITSSGGALSEASGSPYVASHMHQHFRASKSAAIALAHASITSPTSPQPAKLIVVGRPEHSPLPPSPVHDIVPGLLAPIQPGQGPPSTSSSSTPNSPLLTPEESRQATSSPSSSVGSDPPVVGDLEH